MNYYRKYGQMDLTERLAIETGLCRGESFKRIAKLLHRHPSTVAHEVMENRTFIEGTYFSGKDCKWVRHCRETGLCDGNSDGCGHLCRLSRGYDCRKICKRYVSVACHKHEKPPYVWVCCRFCK